MYQVEFADFALEGVEAWQEDLPERGGSLIVPRRHGRIAPVASFADERTILVRGVVYRANEADLHSYLDDLAAVLHNSGEDLLALRDNNRFLRAKKEGFGRGLVAGQVPHLRCAYTVQFKASNDPFWFVAAEQDSGVINVTASPHNFNVTNNGKVRTPVRIQITATGANRTNVKLANTTTSLSATFKGTILQNATMEIDTGTRGNVSVQNGGINGLNDWEGSFWQLEPGVNSLQYVGPTTVDVKVIWSEKFA